MGSKQSKSNIQDEKVFQSDTPISFSPDIVNRLSDQMESTGTTPKRQCMLDAHIRARIHDELEHLKQEEEHVRQEIAGALERENLDHEKAMAGEASEGGTVRNSVALLGDMEEIRSKIEKYQANKNGVEHSEVEGSSAAVAECYRRNNMTPLNCWSEVAGFKSAVDRLEKQHFKSI